MNPVSSLTVQHCAFMPGLDAVAAGALLSVSPMRTSATRRRFDVTVDGGRVTHSGDNIDP